MLNAFDLSINDWRLLLSKWQVSLNHTDSIFKYAFRNDKTKKDLYANFPQSIQSILTNSISFDLPKIISRITSNDGTTQKFILQLSDHEKVEAVLIKFFKRYSVCLSTQVGCGMGCQFCYTGTLGLKRNLKTHEIIGQYIQLFNVLKEIQLDALAPQIVFMGEGEPLHNFENIQQSIEILKHPMSFNLGPSNITLSTVGIIEGLQKIHHLPKINLAFSLHAANQKLREMIIPSAKKNPLSAILAELDRLHLKGRKFITFEYTLIDQINDQDVHIDELIELLHPRKHYALLNLIPFNPFSSSKWKKPDSKHIEEVYKKLTKNNIRTFIRKTQGADILAACGQLKPTSLQQEKSAQNGVNGNESHP
jgi:23S rRNA (adenine2503-C2)-methyltransferase